MSSGRLSWSVDKHRIGLLSQGSLEDNRVIPKGYQIDHIRERSTCVTDKDFESINHFTNLRLMPAEDNRARNWLR